MLKIFGQAEIHLEISVVIVLIITEKVILNH